MRGITATISELWHQAAVNSPLGSLQKAGVKSVEFFPQIDLFTASSITCGWQRNYRELYRCVILVQQECLRMTANLPYLPTPGSIKTALDKIKNAATPERVTQDFIQTKLQIKGGTGAALPSFLKKIGLANSDATPSILYSKFRNTQTSGFAIAESMRVGYRELFDINEYCYNLSDKDLLSLVCQSTGAAADSTTAKLTVACFKQLKAFADFDSMHKSVEFAGDEDRMPIAKSYGPIPSVEGKLGLNLSYTINLNLPATSDQAVFNAIFRSLREHLLNGE